MTSALASTPARLPAAAAAPDRAPARTNDDDARSRRAATAPDAARDGARAVANDAPESIPRVTREATARPGAGVTELERERQVEQPTPSDRAVTRLADRADRLFARLVEQRDLIRRAVEFGDTGAAAEAFGRARDLFAEIIAIGNEARIDQASSEDSAALTDAKERISHRVTFAYEWAALIEEAMPGGQTL